MCVYRNSVTNLVKMCGYFWNFWNKFLQLPTTTRMHCGHTHSSPVGPTHSSPFFPHFLCISLKTAFWLLPPETRVLHSPIASWKHGGLLFTFWDLRSSSSFSLLAGFKKGVTSCSSISCYSRQASFFSDDSEVILTIKKSAKPEPGKAEGRKNTFIVSRYKYCNASKLVVNLWSIPLMSFTQKAWILLLAI